MGGGIKIKFGVLKHLQASPLLESADLLGICIALCGCSNEICGIKIEVRSILKFNRGKEIIII